MKNIFLSIVLAVTSISALVAQEQTSEVLVNKHGTPILPKAGDIAIGIEATPYLNYIGNMFNNSTNNTLNLGSNTLYFRYFLADDAAVRVMLRINNSTSTNRYYVQDDAGIMADPLSRAQTEDAYTSRNRDFILGLGYQKYRGYGRLRGFYGAQIHGGFTKNSYEYTYGNPFTSVNTAPSTHWGNQNSRITKGDNGLTKIFGGGLLAGVEYYFLPKICVGGEVNLNYSYERGGQGDGTAERWNGSSVVSETTPYTPGNTHSSFSTSRPGVMVDGQLYLMFHF